MMSKKRAASELKAAAVSPPPSPPGQQLAASPRAPADADEGPAQRRRVAAAAAEAGEAVESEEEEEESDSSGEQSDRGEEAEGQPAGPATCASVLAKVARSKLIAQASSVFGASVAPAGASLQAVLSNLMACVQSTITGSKLKRRSLAGVLKNLSTKDIPGADKLAAALDDFLRGSLDAAKQECERSAIPFSSQAFKQLAEDAKSEAKGAGDGDGDGDGRADQASSHQVYAALELPDTGAMGGKEKAKDRVRALLATYSLALDERVRPRKMRKLFRGSAGTYSEVAQQFARGVLLASPALFQVQPGHGGAQLSQAALEELDEDTKAALEDMLAAAGTPMPPSNRRESKSNGSPMHQATGGLTPSSSSRAWAAPVAKAPKAAKQPVVQAAPTTSGITAPGAIYLDITAGVTKAAELVNKTKSEFDQAVLNLMCHITAAEEKLPAAIYDTLVTSQIVKDAKRHQ